MSLILPWNRGTGSLSMCCCTLCCFGWLALYGRILGRIACCILGGWRCFVWIRTLATASCGRIRIGRCSTTWWRLGECRSLGFTSLRTPQTNCEKGQNSEKAPNDCAQPNSPYYHPLPLLNPQHPIYPLLPQPQHQSCPQPAP